MFKKIGLLVLGLIILASASSAGILNVSGRAGIYSPPQSGSSPSLMYGLGADLGLTDHLSVRAAIDTTSYSVGGNQYTLTPVTVDIIYHETIAGMVTPYAGVGVGYYSSSVNGATNATTGAQAEAGVSFALGGFNAGVELRYLLPDASNGSSGSMSFNGYASGAFTQSIAF